MKLEDVYIMDDLVPGASDRIALSAPESGEAQDPLVPIGVKLRVASSLTV